MTGRSSMKKFLTLLMCFVLLMTSAMAVGCTPVGPGSNGEKTVIRVFHSNGGTGTQWLRNLEKRFEEDFADKEYATGKKGVDVKVSEDLGDNVDNIASDATDVFFLKRKSAVSLAIKGEVLDLTEWISEDSDVRNGEPISILDKMDDASIKKQSYGSGIYAIPTEFYLEGVSYDVEMFDNECLYIAAAGDTAYSTPYTAEEYVESLGEDATVRFINYDTAPKSLGPDGKPNTSDDGLPSSVSEWLVLCHYMKNVCGIAPMSVSGKYKNYSNHMVYDLWRSLAGERFEAFYNLEGEDIEVVTGVSDTEYLFKTANVEIPMPITKTVDISMANGYEARDMVERYYANAVMEIFQKEGFFAESIIGNTDITHVMAQNRFISNGLSFQGNTFEKVAMHTDGGYWWNESVQNGNFDQYEVLNPEVENGQDRNIAWMSMPVKWSGSVESEGDSDAHDYMGRDFSSGICLVNSNILNKKDTEEMLAVIKDFIHYAFTDESMNEFTRQTGMLYGLDYKVKSDVLNDISLFYRSQIELVQNQPMPNYNMNAVYVNNAGLFDFGLLSGYMGAGGKHSFLDNLRGGKATAQYANTYVEFKEGSFTETAWQGILQALGITA